MTTMTEQNAHTTDGSPPRKPYRKRAIFLTCLVFSALFVVYASSLFQQSQFSSSTVGQAVIEAIRGHGRNHGPNGSAGDDRSRGGGSLNLNLDKPDVGYPRPSLALSVVNETRRVDNNNNNNIKTDEVIAISVKPTTRNPINPDSNGQNKREEEEARTTTKTKAKVAAILPKTPNTLQKKDNDGDDDDGSGRGGGGDQCHFPDVDPFDREVMELVKISPTVDCSTGTPSVVDVIDGNVLKVNQTKVKVNKLLPNTPSSSSSSSSVGLKCRYRSQWMKEGGDFQTVQSPWSVYFTDTIALKEEGDEHLIVECFRNYGQRTPVAKSYFSLPRRRKVVESTLKKAYENHLVKNNVEETLNVMLVGADGISRPQMIRTMPKTRHLLSKLGAFELTKFNKVGMNTFPNVIALLTGKRVDEHQGWDTRQPMDKLPFIWSQFQRAGYYTQLILDRTKVTAFHCSKLGWTRPPVTFYGRPTVVASEADESIRSAGEHCIGDVPEVTSLLDYQLRLARMSKYPASLPFFSYSFFVHLTHDDANLASAGDELYETYFQRLASEGLLNNTAVVFFSDHGPRFGPLRRTRLGMLEGPTPFCYVFFPSWFLQKYPSIQRALQINQHRLSTMFDLHATMNHLLNFNASSGAVSSSGDGSGGGDTTSRGISLLREIPEDRTCTQADVRVEWCACNRHVPEDTRSLVTRVLAYDFVQRLTEETDKVRSLCQRLNLRTLKSAFRVIPASKSADRTTSLLYKMMVETSPGGGVYEGVLEFDPKNNVSRIVGTVDRLNMFQKQSICMKIAKYKPLCYCKDLKDV